MFLSNINVMFLPTSCHTYEMQDRQTDNTHTHTHTHTHTAAAAKAQGAIRRSESHKKCLYASTARRLPPGLKFVSIERVH
jgi:hypothetical protein